MLTVLVVMFIWAAMVTGLLALPRIMAVVLDAVEAVTGVAEAELHTLLESLLQVEVKPVWPWVLRWLVM